MFSFSSSTVEHGDDRSSPFADAVASFFFHGECYEVSTKLFLRCFRWLERKSFGARVIVDDSTSRGGIIYGRSLLSLPVSSLTFILYYLPFKQSGKRSLGPALGDIQDPRLGYRRQRTIKQMHSEARGSQGNCSRILATLRCYLPFTSPIVVSPLFENSRVCVKRLRFACK